MADKRRSDIHVVFNHNPLQHEFLFLVKCKAHIHILGPGAPYGSINLI